MQTAARGSFPPGPEGSSFSQAARFGRDPLGFLDECAERYGDTFTLRLPGDPPRVVCSHPEDVRRIFNLKAEEHEAAANAVPLALGSGSLLFLDGEEHLADRKLLLPLLLGDRKAEYGDLMVASTDRVLARWRPGEPFALRPDMQRVTLDVILGCVFGIRDEARTERLRRVVTEWLELALSQGMFLVGLAFSGTRVRAYFDRASLRSLERYRGHAPSWRRLPWQRVADLKAELDAILFDEVARCRREGTEGRSDVLSRMLDLRYEDGRPMSDRRLVDQLVTLLVGGHETTANSLCWALRYLLREPAMLERLRAEVAPCFEGGRTEHEALQKLPYLDACVQESMRLTPIALAVSRQLTRPLALSRCVAPAGSIAWACVYLTQHRADLWPEPKRFDPSRWLAEPGARSAAESAPREAHYPFGGGRRRCLGMTFGTLELRTVLARVVHRAPLALAQGATAKPMISGITITPDDGLRVRLEGPVR